MCRLTVPPRVGRDLCNVVKALVDDLEIKAIPCHNEKDEGIDVQQMVIAAVCGDRCEYEAGTFQIRTEGWWEDCGTKSRVWRIEHKTDGFKQNVGCGEPDRHTWR